MGVLTTPKLFDKEQPIGCARAPSSQEEVSLSSKCKDEFEKLHGLPASAEEVESSAILKKITAEVFKKAEVQLCRLYDKVDHAGLPLEEYCGRSGGLQVVKRQAVPPTAREHGSADKFTTGLLWMKRALLDLVVMIRGSMLGAVGRTNAVAHV